MEFCTTHKWENADDFTVQGRQKDLLITVDASGNQHFLLQGQTLARQRQRTPEPGTQPIVAPVISTIVPPSTPSTPSAPPPVEPVSQPVVLDAALEITDEEIAEWKSAIEGPPVTEEEQVWSPEHEQIWYTAFVLKFTENYWFAKIEGADRDDPNYRVYVHHSVVAEHFGGAVVGTKIKVRLTPNRKHSDGCVWEALEAQIDDLSAQDAEEK